MSSLTNAPAKFIGKDTHSANLSGSVDGVDPVVTNPSTLQAQTPTSVDPPPTGVTLKSVNVTPTKPVNVVYLNFQIRLNPTDASCTFTIEDNEAIIHGPQALSAGAQILSNIQILKNVTPILHNYEYIFSMINSPPEGLFYNPARTTTTDPIFLNAFVVDVDDTHTAALSGSNTIQTHEQEVLP